MTLSFDRRGSGDPLVLIHGLGSRWQVWEPVLPRLADHYDVVALDLPGFGKSTVDGTPATITGYADRVEKFLTELDIERPHLAGHSLGGAVALELAARGGARSVTAFCPGGFWTRPEWAWGNGVLRSGRALARRVRPQAPRLLRSAVGRTVLFGLFSGRPWRLDPDACLGDTDALLGAAGFDATARESRSYQFGDVRALPEIPVTVAWGSRDALLLYPTQSRRARAVLPFARHITLRGCGHLVFADDPAACLRLLLPED